MNINSVQSPLASSESSIPMSHLLFAISDVWVITCRDFIHWRRQPGTVIMSWFFPIMIALMFGMLFGGAIEIEGGMYFEYLMPGIFAMTMVFGLETTVLAVTSDASKGVTDRFRSMPIHPSAVVLGRCIADLFNSIVGLILLAVAGFFLGWYWHGGIISMLAAMGLLMLLRFSLLWVGIYIGLAAKGPGSLVFIQIMVWPIGFLSSVFVDPSTMPTWLGAIAEWNPLSTTASAARELFMNPGWQSNSWIGQQAIVLSIIWPILITIVFMPLAINRYRHLNR